MKIVFAAIIAVCALLSPLSSHAADDNPIAALPWQVGPTTGTIAGRASIKVPEGYVFLDADGTRRLNEIFENPPSGVDEFTIAPKDLDWTAFFSFNETGYIKDEEKLEPDAILASVREGNAQGNAERRKRGWDPINVVGWSFKPQYDSTTKTLEWAILAQTETSKKQVVNYNTRLLGRKGVMEVVVVASPEDLTTSIASFKALLPGYGFSSGERYAEYRAGDNVAKYGLAALITGGVAAVAAKKGFFTAITAFLVAGWKLVLAGLVGLGAWIRSLLGRKRADKNDR